MLLHILHHLLDVLLHLLDCSDCSFGLIYKQARGSNQQQGCNTHYVVLAWACVLVIFGERWPNVRCKESFEFTCWGRPFSQYNSYARIALQNNGSRYK